MNNSYRNPIKFLLTMACILALTLSSSPSYAWSIFLQPDPGGPPPLGNTLNSEIRILDVYGARFNPGNEIDSSGYNDTSAQNWNYTVNPTWSNKSYTVFTLWPAFAPNLCLTELTSSTVSIETCVAGSGNQLWFYRQSGPASGYTELVSFNSVIVAYYNAVYHIPPSPLLCLDIRGASKASGIVVDLAVCNDTWAQVVWAPAYCNSCSNDGPIQILGGESWYPPNHQ